ncbi:acetyl/propionyl/methylcrotonyl-CoA carboxylase subunit alpha [Streptomyces sp. Inha503]|uniref:acetyl-CoA carboxylase biotin carboxylase subunit n=1 Tax=Streptomyces sp. Inha503 TaxID=3383314 RepID=UPI0039A0C5FF
MFTSLLIANRGEIALRVMRTARSLGIRTIAIYSDADRDAAHVEWADEAVRVGPAPARESYLDAGAVLSAAVEKGADAIHPGYGFLSENASFAEEVTARGIAWVGPSAAAIEQMGDKIQARNLMAKAGIPVARGTDQPVLDVADALARAEHVGYPLMVKSAAGGGGIGMSAVHTADELERAFEGARSRAQRFFGDPSILLEQLISPARHVEVQILGLGDGRVVSLGDRDCSIQRRHQKVLEESPSPGVSPATRAKMAQAAREAARAIGYRGAGTVEFLVNPVTQEFVFLEMNTRLQVEHPITELTHDVDLVAEQLRIAAGQAPGFETESVHSTGHAFELRLYAEDPKTFVPSPGTLTAWHMPQGAGVRVDAGYRPGDQVSPHYDPLLAKICAYGSDRTEALQRARTAMAEVVVEGVKTNATTLLSLLDNPAMISGDYDTTTLERM